MNVTLVDYTGYGTPDPATHAANMLIMAKSTRLEMTPDMVNNVRMMSARERDASIDYIANTIPASWEFVHYTFLICDVTRAFTHQFVRTRTASFAQQTMRVLNKDGFGYGVGPTISSDRLCADVYSDAMASIKKSYNDLIAMGVSIEDARGILPTNILTNIMFSCNLRTLADLVRKRSSSRVQGEYREVLHELVHQVLKVHPWTSKFLTSEFTKTAGELEQEILNALPQNKKRTEIVKLIDKLRMEAV